MRLALTDYNHVASFGSEKPSSLIPMKDRSLDPWTTRAWARGYVERFRIDTMEVTNAEFVRGMSVNRKMTAGCRHGMRARLGRWETGGLGNQMVRNCNACPVESFS